MSPPSDSLLPEGRGWSHSFVFFLSPAWSANSKQLLSANLRDTEKCEVGPPPSGRPEGLSKRPTMLFSSCCVGGPGLVPRALAWLPSILPTHMCMTLGKSLHLGVANWSQFSGTGLGKCHLQGHLPSVPGRVDSCLRYLTALCLSFPHVPIAICLRRKAVV